MNYKIKKKESYYIIAKYKTNENTKEKTKILGEKFIKRNKNKCKIIYKNKIYELKEYIEDIDIYNHTKDLIKLKLIFVHEIIDMSYMFYNCNYLISLSESKKVDKNLSYFQMYIINMHYMFYGCNSLISLPDISNWNTSKVKNMSNIFYECNSLISLPDISKWNTSNVNNMQNMFYKCNSLTTMPDISKWYISKLNNMHNMFNGCNSSIKLPDFYLLYLYQNNITFELTYKNNENKLRILGKAFIEKNKNKVKIIYNNYELELKEYFENIENNGDDIIKFILCLDEDINDLSYMFYECDSLMSVEYYIIKYQSYEINDQYNSISSYSKINISSNITKSILINNYIDLYNNCKQSLSELSNIPNINKTNFFSGIENYQISSPLVLTNISYMFYDCKLLISLSHISNWNTSEVKDMSYIFYGCISLFSLPDISKWNTINVKYMNNMFHRCNSLISLPDISKWNTSNVENMNSMFSECKSLISLPNISKWDTFNVNNMGFIFDECISLISLPDISKWNTNNVNNMQGIFNYCSSLISLPDISKWNISNVNNILKMFNGCSIFLKCLMDAR